jgi:hypothetical protein
MEIGALRDIIVIISGIVLIITAILAAGLMSSVYRKVNIILKSTKTTATKTESLIVAASDELGKPVIQAAGLIHGILYGIPEISKIFKKGE